MTRFLLSLNQAVDTVFAALQTGKAGEIYIPRAPSSHMTDVAKALIGDRKIEIKNTGIRPGEKLYEIMVSDEEAPYVVARGEYYVIQSMLPELSQNLETKKVALTKEYSSDDQVLDFNGTLELLKKNNLLDVNIDLSKSEGELLR